MGLDCDLEAFKSAWVSSVGHHAGCWADQTFAQTVVRVDRRGPPFLESVLENQQIAGVDRYAVGVTLFATYSRARFGDLRSIASILIDEVPPNKEENIGFLEMHSASHKMRATGNRLGSHLPLVAPLEGFGADILGKNIHQCWQGSGSGHEQLASILPTVTCA